MRKKLLLAAGLLLVCFGLSQAQPVTTSEVDRSAGTVLFEDPLKGELKEGWTWIREVPENWQITDEGLYIRMEPGRAGTTRNILRRDVPAIADGAFYISVEVKAIQPFNTQWQQAGLFWMQDDNYRLKFVYEIIDGQLCVFPNSGGGPAATALDTNHVVLRLRIDGNQVTAYYQPDATGEFLRAFERTLPDPRNDETDGISLQCWHGPTDGSSWLRFSNFSITMAE